MAVPAAPPARLASPPLWDDEDLLAVEEEGSEEMMDVDGEVVEEGGSEVRTKTPPRALKRRASSPPDNRRALEELRNPPLSRKRQRERSPTPENLPASPRPESPPPPKQPQHQPQPQRPFRRVGLSKAQRPQPLLRNIPAAPPIAPPTSTASRGLLWEDFNDAEASNC